MPDMVSCCLVPASSQASGQARTLATPLMEPRARAGSGGQGNVDVQHQVLGHINVTTKAHLIGQSQDFV